MNELALMTTEEAAAALTQARLAVLPVGSLEQHGPHLTLDTDRAVAETIARRLASELGTDAVLCPSIGYGLSEHHLGFAGTITLRPATFLSLLDDVLESLSHNGVQRVLIINGHGGNVEALRLAGRTARRDRGMLVASVLWATVAADAAGDTARSPAYGHACEVETSLALAAIPDRVRQDRLAAEAPRRSVDQLTDPPRPAVDESVWLDEWSDDGALGDPSLATREAGEQILEIVSKRTLAFARRMLDRPLPGETT